MKKSYRALVVVAPIVILLSLILFQTISSMKQESPTFDEVILLPAGYSYWKTGDFRLDFDSPPLIKLIAAVPLMVMGLPMKTKGIGSWESSNELIFGHGFLYYQNADRIMFWGRIPIILISLLLAFFVFRWAKELYGVGAGLFALFLYSFEPNILAHSKLVTTDLGVAAFSTIALYYFYRLNKEPNLKNLILSGVTFGLALASKFSAILLIPVYIILSLLRLFFGREIVPPLGFLPKGSGNKRRFLTELISLSLVFLIGLGVVFVIYGSKAGPIYSVRGHGGQHPEALERAWPGQSLKKTVAYFFLERVPVPAGGWFRGLLSQMRHSGRGAKSFLMGEYSGSGWWYYHLIAFLIKTPLALLILLALNILLFRRVKEKNTMDELFLIIFPIIVTFGVSFVNKIAIGLRYILPVYPLLFIFVSRIVNLKVEKKLLFNFALLALSLWFLYSSVSIYPHYLAYFNELVGGPNNGYKYLVDSNLDWGQDLKNLKKYVDENHIKKIKLAYFGTANPDYYRIPYERVTEKEMHNYTPGIFAISATELQNALAQERTRFAWLKKYEPKDKIGYSIFIYEIK